MMNRKKHELPKLPAEDMTIHMLIGEISKITKCALHKESEAVGLPQGYRAIIFHLAHNDGITQLELSRLTHLKPPTISVSLQKMESEGLVSRRADADDLRKTIVTLTEKGREIVSRIEDVFKSHDKAITDSLTPEETQTLKTLLIKVRESVLPESEEQETV